MCSLFILNNIIAVVAKTFVIIIIFKSESDLCLPELFPSNTSSQVSGELEIVCFVVCCLLLFVIVCYCLLFVIVCCLLLFVVCCLLLCWLLCLPKVFPSSDWVSRELEFVCFRHKTTQQVCLLLCLLNVIFCYTNKQFLFFCFKASDP